MDIRKRLKAFFAKPGRKLSAVMPELHQLREVLSRISQSRDPFTEIVPFFNTVSVWHDRGIDDLIVAFEEVNDGQYDEVLRKLRTLQRHFENAGRCRYGINRTKRGERVSADKLFLGGIYGTFTHPVSFWIQRKHE